MKSLLRSFLALLAYLVSFAASASAQTRECFLQNFTEPIVSPGTLSAYFWNWPGWATFPTPQFPQGSGTPTLHAFQWGIDGTILISRGVENRSFNTGTTVTPTTSGNVALVMDCSGYGVYNLFNEFPSTLLSIEQPFSLSSYDGVLDYGGPSGRIYNVGMSVNRSAKWAVTPSLTACLENNSPNVAINLLQQPAFSPNPSTILTLQPPTYSGWGYPGHASSYSLNLNFGYIYSTLNPLAADCNLDGVSDSCEVLVNNRPSTIQPGVPDTCFSVTDCDADNVLDALQIAQDPSLDSSLEFGGDGKLDRCQGRTLWSQPAVPSRGIQNVLITAYWVSGTDAAPIFHSIPSDPFSASHYSDSTGRFLVPREYFSLPPQPGEIMRGIKGSLTYREDTGLVSLNTRTVVNYPGWDPLMPLRSQLFERKIFFPAPVIFQGGVLAKVNGSSVSAMRAFFNLDAGTSVPDAAIKRGTPVAGGVGAYRRPIPSFLLFAMPSGGPNASTQTWSNDGVTWGYVNNPLKVDEIVTYSNALALNTYIQQRVKPILDQMTEGGDASLVPLNIAAHSYGGAISRAFLTFRQNYPRINQYVSFDGAQGGTNVASLLYRSNFFRERRMNGESASYLTPPLKGGWNYNNVVGTSLRRLLISDVSNSWPNIISPDSSALGIGRTIASARTDGETNGHCYRFIGGWELPINEGDHSLQTRPRAIISAARFFADGAPPAIGTTADPGASSAYATVSADPMGSNYQSFGCAVSPLPDVVPSGILDLAIPLPGAGYASATFQSDTLAMVHFDAVISNAAATLELYNGSGSTLFPKVNEVMTALEGGGYQDSFDVNITNINTKMLRLTAPSAASASVRVTFANHRFLTVATSSPAYAQNAAVLISSRLLNSSGSVITPSSGTITAYITNPSGVTSSLQLFDDGLHGDGAANNGVYANTFTGTGSSGFYTLSANSSYTWAGWPIMRSAEASFEVLSTAASLAPTMTQRTIFNTQNGKVDALAIDLTVNIALAGRYRLVGDLVNSSGTITVLDTEIIATNPGLVSSSLLITLPTLWTTPRSSPISLVNVRLLDSAQGQLLGQNAALALTFPTYAALNAPAAPTVSQILPSFGPGAVPGAPANVVILQGANLSTTSGILLSGPAGNFKAQFRVLSDETLELVMPTGIYATEDAPQPMNITVLTAGGALSMQKGYTFVAG